MPTAPPVQQPKKSSGFSFSGALKSLETGLNSVVHEIDKSLTKVYTDPKSSDMRFRQRFFLPPYEALIFELPAKAITVDNIHPGHIYVSYNYIAFYAEFQSQKAAVLIPLRDVTGIQKSMIGKSVKEHLPVVVPYNPHENKLTDQYIVEIYTNQGKVHQFYSIPEYEIAFQKIWATWTGCNKAVAPPVPVHPQPTPSNPIPPQQYYPQSHVTIVYSTK